MAIDTDDLSHTSPGCPRGEMKQDNRFLTVPSRQRYGKRKPKLDWRQGKQVEAHSDEEETLADETDYQEDPKSHNNDDTGKIDGDESSEGGFPISSEEPSGTADSSHDMFGSMGGHLATDDPIIPSTDDLLLELDAMDLGSAA